MKIKYLKHMTHINNLDSIFKYGLLSHNNKFQKIDISNKEVNKRRNKIEPIFHRNLHDYVPFYFNPKNAMLYKTEKEFGSDIIILYFNFNIINNNTIFSYHNASKKMAKFFKNYDKFNQEVAWKHIFNGSWKDNPILKARMMSECLIYKKVNINNLVKIVVRDEQTKAKLKKFNINIEVNKKLFFFGNNITNFDKLEQKDI